MIIVNASGEAFHTRCFVCAQCFQPFENDLFFEFEKRKYCEYDFQVLFAPSCKRCNEFIIGRVIKAMQSSWHPDCFRCYNCDVSLADTGFIKNAARAFCRECNVKEKLKGNDKPICNKCSQVIDDELLRYKGESYHYFHFNCKSCGGDLNGNARELKGDLYCIKCHNKMEIAICAGCRRPIEEERVINALGKQWHNTHFVCDKCEKPFLGTRHYEKRGLAYCEYDYKLLFGNPCFICNKKTTGDVFNAINKLWCSEHYCCYLCDDQMNQKTKFYDFDSRPICKYCFEKLPSKVRTTILKAYDNKDSKLLVNWKKDK